jgi:ABC transporter substrate binding protein
MSYHSSHTEQLTNDPPREFGGGHEAARVHHAFRSAEYIDKILRGATPADIPVEQPAKFDLVINLKTAKAPEITVSPSLLATADGVIE